MTLRETLGHYEVLGPIGAGGMGEVYVARDPKLGRRVAIKMLPLRLTQERDTLTRFTQEARSASALNHPNIVTIHEVGASEGVPYIVMEYIEGTDLRSLISAGPSAPAKALDVAAQIADGLAAAHERGIIHRDLKPENIMLTRDGFVKILDFGLAKIMAPTAEDSDDTLQLDLPATNPGTILGTVGYMSPEQATGRRLDFRSDQFALGAILYELVTGRAAFAAENAIDTLSAILHNDPPPVNRVVTKVPVQLADIIKRLLEKSPDDRYTSTRDLARELRLLRDRVVAEESGFHRSAEYAPYPRKSMFVVAAVALAIFLVGAYFIIRDRGKPGTGTSDVVEPKPSERKYLAVTTFRFRDLTGNDPGQFLVEGFAETLTARLSNYPNVQVMRPPATETETDPRLLAHSLGANVVLTGSMSRSGENIRVNYTVFDPERGTQHHGVVDGTEPNLFGVQDDVAERVARDLQLGTATAQATLDPAVSQKRYLEAVGLLRRYDQKEMLANAVRILKDLGPSPTVEATLARAYLLSYQTTGDPTFTAEAEDAAERALKADPQSVEVNITLGELRRQTGRYEEAIKTFVGVLSQHPTNPEAMLGLAQTYADTGDYERAERTYKKAIELDEGYWVFYHHLGDFYRRRGQYEKAIPQFQKVTQLIPDGEAGYVSLGGMYIATGRYEEAVRALQKSVQRKPTSGGLTNLGTAYYYLGRFQEAAAVNEQAAKLKPHVAVNWRNLGDAYRWVPGQAEKARQAYERAVAVADDAIRVNPERAREHRTRASALAKLGEHRAARAAILRAFELDRQSGDNAYDAAVIAAIRGDEDDALERIEQAVRLGYSIDAIERDPEFANLRKSGRLNPIIQAARSSRR